MADRLIKYLSIAAVASFFAVMWGLLVREHMPRPGSAAIKPNYDRLLPPDEKERVENWGVYLGKSRIGASHLKVARDQEGQIVVSSTTRITIPPLAAYIMGASGTLDADFTATISPLRGLQYFTATSERLDARILGAADGDEVRISGAVGGQKVRTTIPAGANMFLGESLSPMAAMPDLSKADVGRTWAVDMVNPLAGGMQRVTVEVAGAAEVVLDGKRTTVFELVLTSGANRWRSWVRQDGQILIQGTPFGITLRREDVPKEVLDRLEQSAATQPSG